MFIPAPPSSTGSSKPTRRPTKTWAKYALVVIVTLLAYGKVVGHPDGNNAYSNNLYSHANQEVFVAGCERNGATETSCRCAFTWIKQNVSTTDYKAYAHLITSPGYTASQTPAWVLNAIEACRPANGGATT